MGGPSSLPRRRSKVIPRWSKQRCREWALPSSMPRRADPQVVKAAVRNSADALRCAADALLEDPGFATEAKRRFFLLKVTMLSGRSTVVA
eukprot:2201703-Amphidinium_carterae.1